MKNKQILWILLCFIFKLNSGFSQQQRIIVNSFNSKSSKIEISILIELYNNDSINIVSNPPKFKYDTLNLADLDSINILKEVESQFKNYKLIKYLLYSDKGTPKYELSREIQTFLESGIWYDIQETYFDSNGFILRKKFSTSQEFIDKRKKEQTFLKNIENKKTTTEYYYKNSNVVEEITSINDIVDEKIIFYENGSLKEKVHFKNGIVVGAHENYLLNGEISKLEIYDDSGNITFTFEKSLGSYKINGKVFNNYGVKE